MAYSWKLHTTDCVNKYQNNGKEIRVANMFCEL